MSAFMFRLAGVGSYEPPAEPTFDDVSASHQFYDEIEWMAEESITTGFPDGTYRPSGSVSRSAMSAFLYRLAGSPLSPTPAEATFADVSLSHQFSTEIEWMASNGISTGFADGTYRPAVAVSRQSMSAFMYRFVAGTQEPVEPPVPTFADVGTGHPFYGEIEWMAEEGITTGFPGSPPTYRPSDPVTRQSMSAFMYRLAPLRFTVL